MSGIRLLILAFVLPAVAPTAAAQDDVADVPSQDLRAGKDDSKRYFLIGPKKGSKAPAEGFGLVVVMPGGSGDAEFHPFVKRIYKNAIPDGYLVAQPVAVKWAESQQIVWPTVATQKLVPAAKFSTEEFIEAVIEDVAGRHKLNPARIFTLSWSSSGPAAYPISATSKKVTGSFIAMSVYRAGDLPKPEAARGHAYYLYHSPDDRVCPYRMAEQAARDLKKAGASVELKTYNGGHGWRGPLYDDIRTGIKWLEANTSGPRK